ncbi:MAG: hypothetical protein ACXW5U_27885 [Thermoanaerobaculia bacterium]
MRFKRRDGPRIFADSDDLIKLLEQADPLPVTSFRQELAKRNARLVLTQTNVSEVVPQSDKIDADPRRVADLMTALESLPHLYIRIPVSFEEFTAAVDAFENDWPVQTLDPYVDHYWETFFEMPPYIARAVLPADLIQRLDAASLARQFDLGSQGLRSVRLPAHVGNEIADSLEVERSRHGSARSTKATFLATVANEFARWGWRHPRKGLEAFAAFVRKTPNACPSWRIAFEVREEYRANVTCRPTSRDIIDLTHIEVLPFVTHATLDRAWKSRCNQAFERLAKRGCEYPALKRVYGSLGEVLSSL